MKANKKIGITDFLEQKAKIIDATIEKYLPRKIDVDALIFRISPPRYRLDLEALNRAVAEPFWEFLDRGGKRWRPALFLLLCEALGVKSDEALDFAVIPEIIHNGTLIADDVEDQSDLRRGKPCTYRLYGLDIAVNLATLMFFLPMLSLISERNRLSPEKANRLYETYIEEMVNISLGQAIDIAWHRGLVPPQEITEEEYFQMCAYKTGTLARMAAKMACILAGADEEATEKIGRFAESIGIAFQIRDDILDLTGREFARGKGGLGKDITEGKLTLMVIHTLQNANRSDRDRLIEILKAHTDDEDLRMEAISIIKKYGSIEYAEKIAAKIIGESWREVDRILPPSDAKEKLESLVKYLIERKI
ncbi:polyprenyl synthetase family protein [Candidatus Bathyarchaeota archaeon]|nr:polyprenyl synthetase family protein [Candidatus Bathyarchaeota archaeon]